MAIFKFEGHRNSYGTGDVSMVNSEWTTCTVQFVIFPPINENIQSESNMESNYQLYPNYKADNATLTESYGNINYNGDLSNASLENGKGINKTELADDRIDGAEISDSQGIQVAKEKRRDEKLSDADISPSRNIDCKRPAMGESTGDESNSYFADSGMYSNIDKKTKRRKRFYSFMGESESDDACMIRHNEEVNLSITNLVTEWWIEPQFGIVMGNPSLRKLDHLLCQDIPTEVIDGCIIL